MSTSRGARVFDYAYSLVEPDCGGGSTVATEKNDCAVEAGLRKVRPNAFPGTDHADELPGIHSETVVERRADEKSLRERVDGGAGCVDAKKSCERVVPRVQIYTLTLELAEIED